MAVREAIVQDLARTAHIAFRGFNLSPWNAFYRPFGPQYPQDVEESYRQEQQEAITDPSKLFTVIEIPSKPPKRTSDTVNSSDIVGFAIWNHAKRPDEGKAKESSWFGAVLAWLQISLGPTGPKQDRSIDPVRSKLLFEATAAATEKYISGLMELDNMAVDPDFFRRGYGTELCKHGMKIAQDKNISIGLIAAAMGQPLYTSLGFETIVKETVEDTRAGKEASVDFWVQKWTPKAKEEEPNL